MRIVSESDVRVLKLELVDSCFGLDSLDKYYWPPCVLKAKSKPSHKVRVVRDD